VQSDTHHMSLIAPRAFEAEQTSTGGPERLDRSKMTLTGRGRCKKLDALRSHVPSVGNNRNHVPTRSPLTSAVLVLIVGLQDADKIGHAGSIPVFDHSRNLSIGRGLAPLPKPH